MNKLDEIVAYVADHPGTTSTAIFDACDLVPDVDSSMMLHDLVNESRLQRNKVDGYNCYYPMSAVLSAIEFSSSLSLGVEKVDFIDYGKWDHLLDNPEFSNIKGIRPQAILFSGFDWIPKSQLRLLGNKVFVSTWFKDKNKEKFE